MNSLWSCLIVLTCFNIHFAETQNETVDSDLQVQRRLKKTKEVSKKNQRNQPIYIGCFSDKEDRTLKEKMHILRSNNSPKKCAKLCANDGYQYSGLEHGVQCHCGNKIHHHERKQRIGRSCRKVKCNGDKSAYCGGDWRVAIYATYLAANYANVDPIKAAEEAKIIELGEIKAEKKGRVKTAANPNRPVYLGCFDDIFIEKVQWFSSSADIPKGITSEFTYTYSGASSKKECARVCANGRYHYLGLGGWYCWCGYNISNPEDKQLPRDSCRKFKCESNYLTSCGGYLSIAVYSINMAANNASSDLRIAAEEAEIQDQAELAVQKVRADKEAEDPNRPIYIGCFEYNNTERPNRLKDINYHELFDGTQTNSPKTCARNCASQGFQYARLKYSYLCFCSNIENDPEAKKLPTGSLCRDLICPGDKSTYCGSFRHAVVFATHLATNYANIDPKKAAEEAKKQEQAEIAAG